MIKDSQKSSIKYRVYTAIGLREGFIRLCNFGYFILAAIVIAGGRLVCFLLVMGCSLVVMKMFAAVVMYMLRCLYRLLPIVVVCIEAHIYPYSTRKPHYGIQGEHYKQESGF